MAIDEFNRGIIQNHLRNGNFIHTDLRHWTRIENLSNITFEKGWSSSGGNVLRGTSTDNWVFVEHADFIPVNGEEQVFLSLRGEISSGAHVQFAIQVLTPELNFITNVVSPSIPMPIFMDLVTTNLKLPRHAGFIKVFVEFVGGIGAIYRFTDISVRLKERVETIPLAGTLYNREIFNNVTIPPGSNRIFFIQPPGVELIGSLIALDIHCQNVGAGTTGTHTFTVNQGNILSMLSGTNASTVNLRFVHSDILEGTNARIPNDRSMWLSRIKSLKCTTVMPITIQYVNNTNANSTWQRIRFILQNDRMI